MLITQGTRREPQRLRMDNAQLRKLATKTQMNSELFDLPDAGGSPLQKARVIRDQHGRELLRFFEAHNNHEEQGRAKMLMERTTEVPNIYAAHLADHYKMFAPEGLLAAYFIQACNEVARLEKAEIERLKLERNTREDWAHE